MVMTNPLSRLLMAMAPPLHCLLHVLVVARVLRLGNTIQSGVDPLHRELASLGIPLLGFASLAIPHMALQLSRSWLDSLPDVFAASRPATLPLIALP